jgi:hypothetical protein
MANLEDLPSPIKTAMLQAANGDDDYEPMPNTFGVTEVLYCLRKPCLKRIYGKRPVNLKIASNFYRGNIWDKDFTAKFRHNQVRCTYRCRNVPLCISGKFDFLDDTESGAPIITDLKSPASLYFVEKDGKPSDHYTHQVRFYCYCNAQERGRVSYWDGAKYLKFDVDVSEQKQQEVIEYLEGRAAVLYLWKITEKLPTKAASTPDKWECQYCEYVAECEEEEQRITTPTMTASAAQTFLVSDKQPEPVAAYKKKHADILIKRCGRPSERLTEAQLAQATRILMFDVAKQGRIRRAQCPTHARKALTYHYQVSDGVHVFCEACGWTTHFDEYHYHAEKPKAMGEN